MSRPPFKPAREGADATAESLDRAGWNEETAEWAQFLASHGAAGDVDAFRARRDAQWERDGEKGLGSVGLGELLGSLTVEGRQAIVAHLDRVLADAEGAGLRIPLMDDVRSTRALVATSLTDSKGDQR